MKTHTKMFLEKMLLIPCFWISIAEQNFRKKEQILRKVGYRYNILKDEHVEGQV